MLTEAFLSGIAEAVFGHLLAQAEPGLRQWLRRDPAQLAFQRAFAGAYTAFVRQYPEYALSFFDEHFLREHAAAELARLLTRHDRPNPALLAELWRKQFAHPPQVDLILRPVADFLYWLEAEAKKQEALQPLFDSRALERLHDIAAGIEQLRADLDRALKQAARYTVTVEHSQGIVIGNRAQVTQVFNTYFDGNYATLDDFYIRPDSVFQRVRVDEFVGRDWLAAKVDAFLNDPARKSGAFLLVGEAGVGKTSFLAHLVHQRRYLHLFAEQVPGQANLPRALQSLAAQLAARYRLEPYIQRETIPQLLSTYGDFLERLLRLAASTLTEGEKLVIVCDAVDEAGTVPGGNVFGLPAVLPDGVYLILSQRPVPTRLNFRFKIEKETLTTKAPDNIHDVTAYLTTVAQRPATANPLRAQNYSLDDFVRVLQEKSGGNWMYLYYIIDEIVQGERAERALTQLPTGLVGYYTEYWSDWREGQRGDGPEQWDRVYAPLLATLAAAQEPVSAEQLKTWAGVQATSYQIERLLRETWRAFITVSQSKGAKRLYRFYHDSLRDFVTGQIESDELPPVAAYLIDELRQRTRTAHEQIVAYYHQQCNGDWPQLTVQDYARHHLTTHLAGAGQLEELYKLVAINDTWAKARYAEEASYAGYLVDLSRVWDWVESEGGWNIGQQVRCALIQSSIYSLAGNIPPKLLSQLVETELWTGERALAHIYQISDESGRSDAITELAPLLPAELKAEVLHLAQAITSEAWRAEVLGDLMIHLPDNLKIRAWEAVWKIQDKDRRGRVLSKQAKYLPENMKPEALPKVWQEAQGITDERWRAWALRDLAMCMPQDMKMEALNKAWQAAGEISRADERARALIELTAHLPAELQLKVLDEALQVVRESENTWFLHNPAWALGNLASYLSDDLKAEVWQVWQEMIAIQNEHERAETLRRLATYLPDDLKIQVWQEAKAIQDKNARAEALSGLALHLPDHIKAEGLNEAWEAVQHISAANWEPQAVAELLVHLPDSLKAEAVKKARSLKGRYWRVTVLSELLIYLPEDLKTEALREVLTSAQLVEGGVKVLTELAIRLPGNLKENVLREALQAAWVIRDEEARTKMLVTLASHLRENVRTKALQEALKAAEAIQDEEVRAKTLIELAEHLPEALKPEVWQIVETMEEEEARANALVGLAKHLPKALMAKALQAAQKLENEYWRAKALGTLAPHLSERLKSEALQIVQTIKDVTQRTWALRDLALHLSENMKTKVLDEALQTTRAIKNAHERAIALSSLVAHLPDNLKAEARTSAQTIEWSHSRALALSTVAVELHSDERGLAIREALQAASITEYESTRAEALSRLAAHLSDEFKLEALQIACSIEHEVAKAEALSGLVEHLPDVLKVKALRAAQAMQLEHARVLALKGFAPYLPEKLKAEAWQAVKAIQNEFARADAVSGFAAHLPKVLITEAWQMTRIMQNERAFVNSLRGLAAHLPEDLKVEAWQTVKAMQDDYERANALSSLATYLPEKLQTEAWQIARAIDLESARVSALSGLIAHLSDGVVSRVFQTLLNMDGTLLEPLVNIASRRGKMDLHKPDEWRAMWPDVMHILASYPRAEFLYTLIALAPLIARIGGDDAVHETFLAVCDVSHWWP